MKVLLDATMIPADLGGVGRYVDDLVPELVDVGVDLVMAVQPRDAAHFASTVPAAEVVTVDRALRNRAVRMAWEQVGLPGLVDRVRPDVLHSPTTRSPNAATRRGRSRSTTRHSSPTRRHTRW